jgi:hypothetical protein
VSSIGDGRRLVDAAASYPLADNVRCVTIEIVPVATTIFAATDDDLVRRFCFTRTEAPTMRAPTAQLIALDEPIIDPVLEPLSSICRRLEQRAPRKLRTLPHIVMTPGMTRVELGALACVLVGAAPEPFDVLETVDALAVNAVGPLAAIPDARIEDVTRKWSASLRPHGRRVDTWSLVAMRALARVAVARSANVFSHALTAAAE